MIKVGFIGAGQIAAVHAETVAATDGAEVAGFYDTVPDRCRSLAAQFSSRVYGKLDDLLTDIDAVFICTPPKFHREAAIAAARAGVHVFCEKPLADTLADAQAIAAEVAKSGIAFMVGFCFRFSSNFMKLKAIVASGDLGPIHSFYAVRVQHLPHLAPNWRTDQRFVCGMTIESLSHDFDLMRWVVGNPVSVYGTVATDRPDLEGYDNIMSAVMKLESGGMASFHSSWVSALLVCDHGVVGAKGTVVSQSYPHSLVRYKTLADERERIDNLDSPEDKQSSHSLETRHFLECLKTGSPTLTTVEDGVATVKISTALLQSAREDRPIKIEW